MASQITHIRMKEPRKLECKETQQSLDQWKMQFRQYVKQDDHYRKFLSSDIQWQPQETNYGFLAETDGLKRSARAQKEDCCDFLHTLATFLPHGYLTEKIVATSTSFANAFEMIQEHFGLLPTQESFLDIEAYTKNNNESYRQFYERLMAHVRQHLNSADNIMVEGVTVPVGGDKLTVSHSNLVALMWLRKIHPELISIVRTEYSLELRDNKPLASLVPRIAVNVDNLLAKYDKIGGINRIYHDEENDFKQVRVNKTFMKKNANKNRDANMPFCAGCFKMHKTLGSRLHFQHLSSECPRKAAVKLMQIEEMEDDMELVNINDDSDGNYYWEYVNSNRANSLVEQVKIDQNAHSIKRCFNVGVEEDINKIEAVVSTIKSKITSFRRENSPTLHCLINSQHVICIIDEGSVINCCSLSFAKKANIPIKNVSCAAVGANKSPMNVVGIAKYDVSATVLGTDTPCKIKIATLIIINDLGADVLLGQPTKVDNQIVTIPHTCRINFKSMEGDNYSLPYPLRDLNQVSLHEALKVNCSTTIFPSEAYTYKLPEHFLHQSKVCVTERPSAI